MRLVVNIYTATQDFPKSELCGLVNQMRRAAVSIPSNIAEEKDGLRIVIGLISFLKREVPAGTGDSDPNW
jgi:hypothetical protein